MAIRNRIRIGDNLVIDDRTGFTIYASDAVVDYYGQVVKRGTEDGQHPLDLYDGVVDYMRTDSHPELINNPQVFEYGFPPEDWGYTALLPILYFDFLNLTDYVNYYYDFGDLTVFINGYDYGSITETSDTQYYYQSILNTSDQTEDYGLVSATLSAFPNDYGSIESATQYIIYTETINNTVDEAFDYGAL